MLKQIYYRNSGNHAASRRRRGSLYVSVMSVTLIVSIIGLATISVARTQLSKATHSRELIEARKLATSAIEYATLVVKNNSSWRSNYTNNIEAPASPIALGNGTIAFKFVDTDGSLSNDSTDPVRVYGIGRVGKVTYAESVLLQPQTTGISCLDVAFYCVGNVKTGLSTTWATNQTIASGGTISTSFFLSSINSNCEAVGSVSGNITGTKTSGVAARKMPGTEVFDYYRLAGTWIDVNSLPTDSSNNPKIDRVVLSPASNPYGSLRNPEGIYVIDCKNKNLDIGNCRIHGTLVLLNPGSNCSISHAVHWDAAVKNYPALLVNGSISFEYHSGTLSESSLSTNFNPSGTPYGASSDSDQSDSYPSIIKGLIYASNRIEFPLDFADSKVDGCIVCSSVTANSGLILNYYTTYRDYPPPGFGKGPDMVIAPGTRRRESYP
ncbi:MAG: hypothetical protein ACKVT0_03820 [Planctomycetaceae bacterium]